MDPTLKVQLLFSDIKYTYYACIISSAYVYSLENMI